MKTLFTFMLSLLTASLLLAQTANVQVIHNSPTPGTSSGPVVDIYVNGGLLPQLTAVPFRAATSFLPVPAGVALNIEVKVNPSTAGDPAVFTLNLPGLANGGNYQIMAAGVVGDPQKPFNLYVNSTAQLNAPASTTSFNVFHGSPDAPNVDVNARLVGNLVSNLAFGSFSNYLPVPSELYYVDVLGAGSPSIVQTYETDLSAFDGLSATVFASGYLGGNPAFGLFAVVNTPIGVVVAELPARPVARVQVIHNSLNPTVDVWANQTLLYDNLEYQTAEPFAWVDANTPINFGIALANSTSASQAIFNSTQTLLNGGSYYVVAAGEVGNMSTPFNLFIKDGARESASATDKVDFMVFHGVTDASNVAVDVRLPFENNALLLSNLGYGNFTNYISVDPEFYDLSVNPTGTNNWVTFVEADLEGADGLAFIALATGKLGSTANPFDIMVVLPNGASVILPANALANIIHNSPIEAAGTVDIFINGQVNIEDFNFREATGLLFVPARVPLDFAIGAANTPIGSAFGTFNDVVFDAGKIYTVYAIGDNSPSAPFTLSLSDAGRFFTANGPLDLRAHHGSTTAPAVDVLAGSTPLFTNLAYGDFSTWESVPTANYELSITPAGQSTVVAKFGAPLGTINNAVIEVFASGYLSPTGTQPAFGLFAAFANGDVVELPLISNTADVAGLEELALYPNPAYNQTKVTFTNTASSPVSIAVLDYMGRIYQVHNVSETGKTEFTLNTSDLPMGAYYISIANSNGYKMMPLSIVH